MSGPPVSSRSFTVGLLASAAVHVAGVTAFSKYVPEGLGLKSDPSLRRGALEPLEIPPPEPEAVTLGLEDSIHETKTWLGFAEPTEHKARAATVEQAAMDPLAGRPSQPSAPSQPGAQSQTPSPSRASSEAPRAAAAPPSVQADHQPAPVEKPESTSEAGSPRSPQTPRTEVKAPGKTDEDRAEAEPRGAASREPRQEPVRPATPVPHPAPEPKFVGPPSETHEASVAEPKSSASQSPATASPQSTGERPGERANRQSTPSALDDSIEVIPGRPAAAKGLEISTVRPEWSDTTRLVAVPRNPVVRLTFNRAGAVSQASFLPGQSTGLRAVDEPLLDAMYRWTAKGGALRSLPSTPDAGLTIQFRIMLRK